MITPINKVFEIADTVLVTEDTLYIEKGFLGVLVEPEGDGNWLVDFGEVDDEGESVQLYVGEEEMMVVEEVE